MKLSRVTPADWLTLFRLVTLPVLWLLALNGESLYLGVLLAVAGVTDVLDGPVARITDRRSRYGGQLDSIADILLMASIFWWLVMLRPEFFVDNAVPLIAWAVIGVAALIATFVKFGRIGNLHLYSAKAAGVIGYLFVVWVFVFESYGVVFFGIAIGAAILAATETLLVALTRDRVNDRIRSILLRPR